METNQNYDEMFMGIERDAYAFGGHATLNGQIMSGVTPIWYKQLAAENIPPPSWVVDKMVPTESITIISAPPAQYKTWLALDIAISVALGKAVFDHFETKQTNVLIIDEESGRGRLRKRLQMLGVTDETPIAIASCERFKLDEESAESTTDFCLANSIGLVVFDSLTRIHNADENSAKDMSVVMSNFKRLTQDGIAVIVIHHNRKPGQFGGGGANEMRGSGDILAASDVQISVKRKSGTNLITVSQNKNRDAPDLAPFDLEVASDEDKLWFKHLGATSKQPDKSVLTEAVILESLSDGKPRTKAEITSNVKLTDGVGGDGKISAALKALADTEKITMVVRAHGTRFYQLKQDQEDE